MRDTRIDGLKERIMELEDSARGLQSENRRLRSALLDARHAMEDQDIFGDDPRVTAAIRKIITALGMPPVVEKLGTAAADTSVRTGAGGAHEHDQQEHCRYWQLRWHYACPCGWIDRKENYETEPATCPECGSSPTVK